MNSDDDNDLGQQGENTELDIMNTDSWTGELIINATMRIPIRAQGVMLDGTDICIRLHHPGAAVKLPEDYSAIRINWKDAALVSIFVNEGDLVVNRYADSDVVEITLRTSRIESKLTIRSTGEPRCLKEIVFRANFADLKNVCTCRRGLKYLPVWRSSDKLDMVALILKDREAREVK